MTAPTATVKTIFTLSLPTAARKLTHLFPNDVRTNTLNVQLVALRLYIRSPARPAVTLIQSVVMILAHQRAYKGFICVFEKCTRMFD